MTRESTKRTDAARILTSLKGAGGRGITQRDWDGPNTPDGGGEIKQIARRILDLRAAGHTIETRKDPLNKRAARYVLIVERWERIATPSDQPAADERAATPALAEATPLLPASDDGPVRPGPLAGTPYDPFSDAA